ncbi:MAG: WD40 repeat domain-containing protein [Armatimonadota bacterium]|nr:WD40 repeat domain-containing protein [Armatimonadota bacterium]
MYHHSLNFRSAQVLLLNLLVLPTFAAASTPAPSLSNAHLNGVASIATRQLVIGRPGIHRPRPIHQPGPITSIAFSPGGGLIATASNNESAGTGTDDHSIRLWSVRTGGFIVALKGHPNPVQSLAFSPDSRLLASASTDGTIRIWNVNRRRLWMVLRASKSSLNTVAFDPTGSMLVSGGDDQAVRFWSLRPVRLRRTVQTLPSDDGHVISVLRFSPDGSRLAVGMSTIQGAREDSYNGSVEIWNAHTGRRMVTLAGFLGALGSVAFSPDGAQLATGEYQERGRTGLEMQENTPSGADRGVVRLWNARSGKPVATLLKHGNWYPSVAFFGRRLMAAIGQDNGQVQLWRLSGSKLSSTLGQHGSPVRSVALSPRGGTLAAGREDGTLWIHQLVQR